MTTFRRTKPGVEGYAVAEVDAFVTELETALSQRPPTMRPEDVHAKLFHIKRVHAGYDEREVDAFLDDAEHRLRVALGEVDPPAERRRFGWLHAVGTVVMVLALVIVILIAARAFV